jgi:hypothetical protein
MERERRRGRTRCQALRAGAQVQANRTMAVGSLPRPLPRACAQRLWFWLCSMEGREEGGGKKPCRPETPSACMCSRRPALLLLSEPSVWLWDPPGWGTCVRSTREAHLATSLDGSIPQPATKGTTASRGRSIAPGCHAGLAGPSAATRPRHSRQQGARRGAQRRQAWLQNVRRKTNHAL